MAQEDSGASNPNDASASTSSSTPPAATSTSISTNPNPPPQPSSRPSSTPPSSESSIAPALPANAPQQNGDARSSSSPAMSNSHPPAGPPRQPVSYPSPASYHSPAGGMPPTHYSYPASSTQPPSDGYRSSAGPPVPLPSMRSIDPMQSQPQAPPAPQSMPLTMAMGPGQGMPYYNPQMAMHHNPYGIPPDPAMTRYALPPHDARMLGPRGPKKEIKRRTKTGCLTCRKRRIKCDETHPSCNNCKKSKRECLGYDPIFKQQQGPATIQPAPGTQSISTPTVPSSVPTASAPPSNPYGNQPAVLASSYGSNAASSTSFDPTLPSPASNLKSEGFDYSSTIDPALQTVPASASSISTTQTNSSLGELKLADNLHLRAKKMKIDEILDLLGPAAPAQEMPVDEAVFNEITRVYHEIYAPGLVAFFESKWFIFRDAQGANSFVHHKPVLDQFAAFLKVLEKIRQNDHSQMTYSGILETRIVWALAILPYTNPEATNSASNTLPPEADAIEARNRVKVVDALLCGDYLPFNPLTSPIPDANPHRTSEFEFWYNLAEFVVLRDEPNANKAGNRDEVLSKLRHLLDGRENRDLIYSIAIARELAPRFEPGYENHIPQYLDESDPKNKLVVASKFIQDEAQTGGTTNIVRRISEIAIRAFINPGVNIASGANALRK